MLRSALGVLSGAIVWTAGLIYLAAVHLAVSWPLFPWWYNFGVVVPALPAVLLGARLAGPADAES